jgi:galactofuranosylgalactofuranosylrhamnosyl-N-acetylglucosaminyl-diphospho-decaprenol beta-1,5/1,6-galactofuranosyltransferase
MARADLVTDRASTNMTVALEAASMDQDVLDRAASTPLQSAIWPQAQISTEVAAHFRVKGPVGLSLTDGGADFAPGGRLSSGAYYNLFNLGKWRRNCGDLPLALKLSGRGRFLLSVQLARRNRSKHQIVSEIVVLDGDFYQPLELDDSSHADAVLFFELTALDDAQLNDFAWSTTAPRRSTPEMVLSVTTFRRENEVAETAERFRRFLSTSDLKDHIRMVIVDNGSSLEMADGGGVTVIKNENLGGSGGFSRGLLSARDSGATHCLFMDDDASIQMEAVSRTWWFLAYALDPRTAVAGAMINASARWEVWENGAVFDLVCKPRFGGLDLRKASRVFEMEYDTTAAVPDDFYGGWWFFAFPIQQVEHLPFPFFVRGDDVSFSLVNDFRIVTLPGVASVQESFTDKASPLTWYLDFRSHLIHHLSLPAKQRPFRTLMKMVQSFYLRNVLRFHYDSLSAVNLALEDVMRGPAFFREHADMTQRRADLKAMATTEVWHPITAPPRVRLGRLTRPFRALYLLALNGHLLPIGDRVGYHLTLSSPYRDDHRKAYGAAQITYLNADQTAAYVVRRDRSRFWRETVRLVRNTLRLRRDYTKLMREWEKGYDELTSDAYWTDKLRLDQTNES